MHKAPPRAGATKQLTCACPVQVYLALCEHNGITPPASPSLSPSPEADTSHPHQNASQQQQHDPNQPANPASDDPSLSQATAAAAFSVGGGTASGSGSHPGGTGAVDVPQALAASPVQSKSPLRSSPLGSTPVRSPGHSLTSSADPVPVPASLPHNTTSPRSTDTPSTSAAALQTATTASGAGAGAGAPQATHAVGAVASRCFFPTVAVTISGEVDDALPTEAILGYPGISTTSPDAPGADVSTAAPGPPGGSSSTGNSSEKVVRRLGLAGPHRLLSMRHSAPVESFSQFSSQDVQKNSPVQGQVAGGAAVPLYAPTSGARSMRRVVSADRVRPGQKQKRGPDAGVAVPVVRSSMEAAAAAALRAVEEEAATAAAGQAEAEPPRKRHLSPGDSAGSDGVSSWGGATGPAGVSRCGSLASGSLAGSDAGHLGGMSPFFDSHPNPTEASLIKRASSSSDASVAKLALALVRCRFIHSLCCFAANTVGEPSLHEPLQPHTCDTGAPHVVLRHCTFDVFDRLHCSVECKGHHGSV